MGQSETLPKASFLKPVLLHITVTVSLSQRQHLWVIQTQKSSVTKSFKAFNRCSITVLIFRETAFPLMPVSQYGVNWIFLFVFQLLKINCKPKWRCCYLLSITFLLIQSFLFHVAFSYSSLHNNTLSQLSKAIMLRAWTFSGLMPLSWG